MPSQGFRPRYEAEALSAELAKILTLVAPSSMTVDQQTLWLASAVDALADIRAAEVQAVSSEVRRTATRHNQIVPEIAKLVAARRSRKSDGSSLEAINAERVRMGLGAVRWVKRDGRSEIEFADLPLSPGSKPNGRDHEDGLDAQHESRNSA
jgi:hypothetical protein